MSAPDPVDRRVRKSRAALTAALLAALREGVRYDRITVDDLARRADVARATFYAHWADKDALYLTLLEDLAAELEIRFRAVDSHRESPSFDGAGIYVAFQHAQENADIYLPMLEGAAGGGATRLYVRRLRDGLVASLTATATRWGTTPRLPLDVIAQAQAGAFFALLGYWLRDGESTPSDAAALADIRHLHEVNGLAWALGLDPGTFSIETGSGTAATAEDRAT
jgi:AcrR family transcriptional regulator